VRDTQVYKYIYRERSGNRVIERATERERERHTGWQIYIDRRGN